MKDASDYLAYIKALIVVNPHVLHGSVIREEAQGDMGLLRYKSHWMGVYWRCSSFFRS